MSDSTQQQSQPVSSNQIGGLRRRYGEWAVVTGASDGIGEAFARELAGAGLNLVIVARRRDRLDVLASELEASHATQVRVLAIDLTHVESAERLVAETDDLDVGLLVAAAGFGSSGPLVESGLAAELEMVDLNCRAVLALTHHFARRFIARRRGGIVLMSSLLAFQGVPLAANYAATKAYIQSLAEALRHELGPFGVDVIASAPGPIHSGFAARANMRMGMAQRPQSVASATLARLGADGTVRPGWLSKLLEYSLRLLPRSGRVLALARVMRGMAVQR